MPPRPWADEPRLQFLRAALFDYETAKERKKTTQFLAALSDDYFKRFPQPDEQLMTVERRRIKSWMNNHSGGRGKSNSALLRATRVSFRELLRGKVDAKRRQKLQATQAYSELYWNNKLKPIIETEWQQKKLVEPGLPQSKYLAYMNGRVRQLYEAESEDIKDEVEQYRNSQIDEDDTTSTLFPGEDELDEAEQERRIAAREIQSAIDNVECILTSIAKDIEVIAGLKTHFLVSGPEPKRNGSMVIFTIASGRKVLNNESFNDHPTYKADVHDKFLTFAKGCYTREERTKYSDVPMSYKGVNSTERPVHKGPSQPLRPPVRAFQQLPIRKKARNAKKINTVESSDSDSNISDESESEITVLDAEKSTISREEEDDDANIFSPSLPPDRRIIDTKKSASGLTLYKTAGGEWKSEAELQRLANMARNSRLLEGLGIEQAKRLLTTRLNSQVSPVDKGLGIEDDDREFSAAHIRTPLPSRERYPRQSKQNPSYVERKSDGVDLGISLSRAAVEPVILVAAKEAISESTSVSGDVLQPVATDHVVTSDDDGAPRSVSASFPTESSSQDHLTREEVISPSQVADNKQPVCSNAEDDHMDVDDFVGPALLMDVDGNASLDDASPLSDHITVLSAPSLATSSQNASRAVNLDSVDLMQVPPWLRLPLKHLQKHFRGEIEDRVLGAFVALEIAWQPLDKRIGTKCRPKAVAWWLKNARPINKVPQNIDLASFPGEVRGWWATIQPKWRVPIIEDWPLPQQIPAQESWKEARLGGSNGLFLLLICLHWWRQSAKEESDKVALAEYASVAEDVAFVFEAILASGVSLSRLPLTGSARADARASAPHNNALSAARRPVAVSRSLRSSAGKESMRSSRTRRSQG